MLRVTVESVVAALSLGCGYREHMRRVHEDTLFHEKVHDLLEERFRREELSSLLYENAVACLDIAHRWRSFPFAPREEEA